MRPPPILGLMGETPPEPTGECHVSSDCDPRPVHRHAAVRAIRRCPARPRGRIQPSTTSRRPSKSPSSRRRFAPYSWTSASSATRRGFLQVMSGSTKIRAGESGRLELANWIASKNNPLTASSAARRRPRTAMAATTTRRATPRRPPPRCHRRIRLRGGRRQDAHPRLARGDSAPARFEPREADLQLCGPRDETHGREGG